MFTIGVISFLSFVIILLPPGDWFDRWIILHWGDEHDTVRPTPEEEYELQEQFGLNKPMVVQYWDWISGMIFRAEFGHYYTGGSGEYSVRELIARRLPPTIYLAAFTMLITWSFSIPVGIYSAVRQHSLGDYTFTFLGFAGLAMPDFLLGLVLMYIAFAYLGANQDAWAASESIGIHRRNSANYQAEAPDLALRSTAEATSRWVRRRRKAGKVERFFVEEDLVKIKGRSASRE